MKAISFLKWFLPVIFLIATGVGLVVYGRQEESKLLRGHVTYAAATTAVWAGDAQTAYVLYIQSSHELEDPKDKAVALYEAANVGWIGEIADYDTLVGLYKQSLRYDPNLYEAAFNLEYLYWLKLRAPELLPQLEPGLKPGREEHVPSGDI